MSAISITDSARVGIISHLAAVPNSDGHRKHDCTLCLRPRSRPNILATVTYRTKKLFLGEHWLSRSRTSLFSTSDDSGDTDDADKNAGFSSGRNEMSDAQEDELTAAKRALSEAQARQDAIKKERDQLLQELEYAEAKQQEYVGNILHDKDVAVSELEAAKSMFDEKMQESVQEKSGLEDKLVLTKQDAVELALQVERLAEIAYQQATVNELEDARLRVAAAETTAAEATYQIEKEVKDMTEDAILSMVEQSKNATEKALNVAEKASDHATKAASAFNYSMTPLDELALVQSKNVMLQSTVNDLESQLLLTRSDVAKLKMELEKSNALTKLLDVRAKDAETALVEFQDSRRKENLQREQEVMALMEKMKKDTSERNQVASSAFNVELQSIKDATEAAKETLRSRDDAYLRRCKALLRTLQASEASTKMWRQRAEAGEFLLLKERQPIYHEEDSIYVVNGGRIDLLMDNDSQKWKLLSDGPRREVPQRMARIIRMIRTMFPPRKFDVAEALSSKFRSLNLPKAADVWSIALEKPKEGDTLIKKIVEKETIEKKRKALERVLHRKTIQWQRTEEQKKFEPGTGTGYEIVFQGFNWESWRRQWYLDLAPKAADLSKIGVTAVWLPPPTESVAPQGYMPSDLYNLNSAYGTKEDLKFCIGEMNAHDILALGDVVLNHRCAHKQSPNGVWNIFGGKLAWGPEAIVCDDPSFQGRGNPSSGDIFHAAPNIDHSKDLVRNDIKEWLNWLRNDIGFDGWRLDFVRGFSGVHVKEYIEASSPAFAIGEYWDSLAYENENLCYNQDAHRQRIVNWINATGGSSSAFDVTTKGILHSALHNQYWRLIDPQGKPTGVMGWWPSRAVTFLENHDTGSTQAHWPFPRDKLGQGYAYILTHPGTPTIFYDHLYDFGLHDILTELIEARRRARIHCRSSVKIYHANNEGYVAQVGDTLVMKLGHFDWNPSKENQLEGSWQKFIDKGAADYIIWLRQ